MAITYKARAKKAAPKMAAPKPAPPPARLGIPMTKAAPAPSLFGNVGNILRSAMMGIAPAPATALSYRGAGYDPFAPGRGFAPGTGGPKYGNMVGPSYNYVRGALAPGYTMPPPGTGGPKYGNLVPNRITVPAGRPAVSINSMEEDARRKKAALLAGVNPVTWGSINSIEEEWRRQIEGLTPTLPENPTPPPGGPGGYGGGGGWAPEYMGGRSNPKQYGDQFYQDLTRWINV